VALRDTAIPRLSLRGAKATKQTRSFLALLGTSSAIFESNSEIASLRSPRWFTPTGLAMISLFVIARSVSDEAITRDNIVFYQVTLSPLSPSPSIRGRGTFSLKRGEAPLKLPLINSAFSLIFRNHFSLLGVVGLV